MTTSILNLASYRVLRVEETEYDYHVYAEAVQSIFFCPTCNSSHSFAGCSMRLPQRGG